MARDAELPPRAGLCSLSARPRNRYSDDQEIARGRWVRVSWTSTLYDPHREQRTSPFTVVGALSADAHCPSRERSACCQGADAAERFTPMKSDDGGRSRGATAAVTSPELGLSPY